METLKVTEHLQLLPCLPSGLTTQGSGVRGRRASLSSPEGMQRSADRNPFISRH
ncbi:hypothetical protein FHS01_000802 [Longimicrobium terrae]|uniref:Uncharacterized protein n=1 Tax=Longimicrobium terrae TaxID=1639882 RepID=A0A841GKR7_9BACT|nr:hypothetical protein [Longimicrobium terrae]MBB6069187.1 hypothetical protein [Longimicrobium terrae]